jgi:hypothetical protein
MKNENKLIAEFMYMRADPIDKSVMIKMTLQGNEVVPIDSMEYQSCWKWLMPVVDKIESLRDADGNAYRFLIDMCNAEIENTDIIVLGASYKRDAVYNAVVEFINQYNK